MFYIVVLVWVLSRFQQHVLDKASFCAFVQVEVDSAVLLCDAHTEICKYKTAATHKHSFCGTVCK